MSHRQAVAFLCCQSVATAAAQMWTAIFDWRKEHPVAEEKKPLFKLGQVVMTPGARDALHEAGEEAFTYLFRHAAGDWGTLPPEDEKANEDALKFSERLLSAYFTAKETKIWVITEWDRSVTTLLLPSEY